MADNRSRALDNKCPSCGAPILYNATTHNWVCEYCHSKFSLEEMKKYNNASSKENNEPIKKVIKKTTDNTTYVRYFCKNCNAEIIADENTASTFCVYCGNTAILKEKLSGEFAPSKIIPFKKDKNYAINGFKMLKKGRPFVPKDFVNEKNIEKITGVYIPFWLYDVMVNGELNVKSTRVASWRSGDYAYTKTDIYAADSIGEMSYGKVPVDGSSRFANDIMNAIEPFDYSELEEYNHAYLSGFLAEKYDVDSSTAFEDARKRTVKSTTDKMLSDMSVPGSKVITNNTLAANIQKTDYVLLPVWMVNVKYNNKYYTFAMNGQTGEFVGNIPLSVGKVILWYFGLFFLIAGVGLLLNYLGAVI